MARSFPTGVLPGLQARTHVFRDFISLFPRNRSTGAVQHFGFWSDHGTVTAQIREPTTNQDISRSFTGAGTLISISEIMAVENLSVQEIEIDLSQVSDNVALAIREWDPEQAQVEVYRGVLDLDTHNLIGSAYCRFYGFVDRTPIRTPAEGGEGSAKLICRGHTQELYRSNPSTRSHEDQQQRDSNDTFFRWVEPMAEREVWWGQESGKG